MVQKLRLYSAAEDSTLACHRNLNPQARGKKSEYFIMSLIIVFLVSSWVILIWQNKEISEIQYEMLLTVIISVLFTFAVLKNNNCC